MIDLPAISEEEIAAQQLSTTDLWLVRLGDDVYGPFQTEALKAYAVENGDVMADADVSPHGEANWVMYLQSSLKPVKQKEPPKLVSAQTLQTYNAYYLEQHGHRVGPSTHEEMAQKVRDGKVSPMDLISYDEGMTWHKLFELKEFELRPHSGDQLPASPLEETFQRGHGEALQSLMADEDPVHEGLVSLGHYTFKKQGTTLNLDEVQLPKEQVKVTKSSTPTGWWISGGAAATAALALMIWWTNAPTKGAAELVVQETGPSVESVPPGESLLNPSSRSRRGRTPASVMPTRVESPRAMRDTRRELDSYRETHDMNNDRYEPSEPMDVDPYGADAQLVQDDRSESIMRRPSGGEAPDDGYRMEEPSPAESGPIVEEVGDF
ncbi:MAG: hypothetical protein ACLGG7_08635 [Bacteriovoracia bacterium]